MKKTYWINNGTTQYPHYDFLPPKTWSKKMINEAQTEFFSKNELTSNSSKDNHYDHLELVKNMPEILQEILALELKKGNTILSISKNNWPTSNSIIVSIRNPFHDQSKNANEGAHWRRIANPHYCKEEISKKCDGIEHLIIA